MEGREMRRGVPCWYKRPDVGLDGVYDATLIQSAMYTTLKKHFGAKPYYKHVLETFNVVSTVYNALHAYIYSNKLVANSQTSNFKFFH